MKTGTKLAVFAVCSAVFVLYSEIDLIVSRWFYDPVAGGFYFNNYTFVQVIYDCFKHLPKLLLPALVLFLIVSIKLAWCKNQRKLCSFALIALLIGPGLIVHTVFKDSWDRARPRHIVEFGGTKEFSPAWVISDQCERNCSFVSGHAAMGFYFMILGWLLNSRKWLYAGIGIGALVGMIRVFQGGHFISDSILAGFVVYWSFWLMAKWMKIPEPGSVIKNIEESAEASKEENKDKTMTKNDDLGMVK